MSINAGELHADAVLDISQVDAATAKLVQNIERVNTAFASIKTPKLALDTTAVDAKAQATSTNLTTLLGKLTGIPVGKVNLDVGQAEQNVEVLNKTLNGLLGTVGVNTTALGGLTGVLGAGGLVAAAGAATVALAQLGIEFRVLNRALENNTIASGEALKALRSDFDALFRSVPADGGDIVKAQAIIFQEFRQTGEGARALVADLSAFTRVMGGDLATNTRQVVDVFNAWNVATEDQAQTLRDLANISKATGQPIGQLTSDLTRQAVAAQALGLNIKETGVLMDALGDAGVQPRIVLSALRTAMNNLTTSGGESTEFFRDTLQAIKAFESDAEAAAAAATVFGEQAGPTMARLIRSGRLELDAMVQEIEEARDPLAGTFAQGNLAAQQFQKALNGLKSDLGPAGTAVLTFAATFGVGLVGAIKQAQTAVEAFMGSGAVKAFLKLHETVNLVPTVSSVEKAATSFIPGVPLIRGAQTIAGAGEAAGPSIAQQAAATEHLTDANEQGVKAHNDLATAQANVAAASQKAKEEIKSLDDQLRAAGGDQQLIQTLLTGQQQVKDFDAAIAGLTDKSFAAFLVAQRNLAEEIGKATGDWTAYDAVIALAGKELDDQKTRTDAATQAQKEAKKATDDLAAAQAKAARAGVDLYAERLNNLANAVMPNLDEATAVALKQALLLGDQQAALGIIAAATGQSQQALAAGLHASGAAAADAAKEAAAAAKGFDGFLTDELRSRWSSVLGTLSSGTDAATAAQAKLLEASGKTDEALTLLLQHAGASPAAIGELKRSLEAGGAAAFTAREAIQALVTFIRDSRGNVRLKVDVDIEAAEKALGDLQRSFREANAKRADAESKATREFGEQQSAVAQQRAQLSTDLIGNLKQVEQARTDSSAQLGRDIQSAVSSQNDALEKISRAREDAAASFTKTVDDTQDKLTQTATDIGKRFGEGIAGIGERTNQAMEAFANAQASALRSLSSAMSSFNQQQVQAAFDASVAAQDAANRGLTDRGVFGTISNQERIKEIQEAGRAALQQVAQQDALAKAKDSVAQQQLDATKTLTKAMADVAEESRKLREKFAEDLFKAQDAADKADRDAIDKLEKANRDAAIQEQQANEKARDAARESQRQDQERQRAEEEKAREAQQKFFDARIQEGIERGRDPEGKFRTQAERDFDDAEKARREEQRQAEKQFEEQRQQQQVQLDILKALKRLTGKLDRPNVSFGTAIVIETGKDLLTKAERVAQQRLRV